MKERLTNNLGLKILAIFLAFFLWLIVSNVSNPARSDSKEVPVDIINKEVLEHSNLTYEVVGKSTVTVNYEVRTLDAYKIKSSDFYAYADLSELYDVTGAIPIKIDIVNNKSLFTTAPTTKPGVIQIKTEEIQEKPFELWIQKTGKQEDGYAVGDISLTPRVIYATGAVSAIGKINSIGVVVSVEGANSDFTTIVTPVFYDSNGNSIDLGKDVTLNTTEITAKVTMLKVKDLALDFQVRGTVADGYRFTGVESDIKSVSVEGMKSQLASLSTLVIPGEYLNLDGATRDVVVQVDLSELLPENVNIAGDGDVVANVTMKVEPLEIRGFQVDLKDAVLEGASEDLKYEFNATSVQVDIEGLTEDLDALSESTFKPVIDVSGMTEGEHRGNLTLTPGEGFEVINIEGFDVTVTAVDPSRSSTSPTDEGDENDQESSKGSTRDSTKESTREAEKEKAKETAKASS